MDHGRMFAQNVDIRSFFLPIFRMIAQRAKAFYCNGIGEKCMTDKKYGVTSTTLKLFALVLMTLDHLYEYLGFTGVIPLWFHWVGRLAAPIFVYMVTEGYYYTHSKESYLKRLYCFSVLTGLTAMLLESFFPHPLGVTLRYNIFSTMFLIVFYLYCIDCVGQKGKGTPAKEACMWMLVWQCGAMVTLKIFENSLSFFSKKMLACFLPTPLSTEGGVVFVAIGVLIFVLRGRRMRQFLCYLILSLAYLPVYNMPLPNYLAELTTEYSQWMMVFAVLPLIFYNGKRGKNYKKLFYWYYPIHMFALYLIGNYLCRYLNIV